MRGLIVYCLEDKDLPSGVAIENVRLDREAKWRVRHDASLLRGVTVLESQASVLPQATGEAGLYRRVAEGQLNPVALRLIPDFAWCNRGESQMSVWLPAR